MQSLLFVTALLSGAEGLRKSSRNNGTVTVDEEVVALGARGSVANLLSYGAPKVSAPALTNAMSSDGCFPGYRFVTKKTKLVFSVDMVPTLMKTLPYAHPKIDIEFLHQSGGKSRDCGWTGNTVEIPDWKLHGRELYIERTVARFPFLEDASRVALEASHIHELREAAAFVAGFGYRLVGHALDRDEASHLIQNPQTGDCFVTYEGSDRFSDWLENFQIFQTDFCGLSEKVHTGFKKATMGIVAIPSFQSNVRPKLGHCRKVEVVGHSLGGAIATLFTACAHNTVAPGAKGHDEWQNFWWTKKETKIMDALV